MKFKEVLGGAYRVSDTGEVWSKRRKLQPGLAKGYEFVILSEGPLRFRLAVHVAVAALFIGKKPKGTQVNHKDGDKLNNRVENLEYISPQENTQHARTLGLGSPGYLKLSAVDAGNIRGALKRGVKGRWLAKHYGVSEGTISQIKRGKVWKN